VPGTLPAGPGGGSRKGDVEQQRRQADDEAQGKASGSQREQPPTNVRAVGGAVRASASGSDKTGGGKPGDSGRGAPPPLPSAAPPESQAQALFRKLMGGKTAEAGGVGRGAAKGAAVSGPNVSSTAQKSQNTFALLALGADDE
jgi:hypothetical protein